MDPHLYGQTVLDMVPKRFNGKRKNDAGKPGYLHVINKWSSILPQDIKKLIWKQVHRKNREKPDIS